MNSNADTGDGIAMLGAYATIAGFLLSTKCLVTIGTVVMFAGLIWHFVPDSQPERAA